MKNLVINLEQAGQLILLYFDYFYPFGHSNTNPRIYAEMGFDAWFFARLDYQDKEKRLNENSMEFIWRPSFNHLGKTTEIFTHALYHHYSAPEGFNFDMWSHDAPIIDDPQSQQYNLDMKLEQFYNWITNQRVHYKSQRNMLILMGDDFQYQNARQNFGQIDTLIKHFNQRYSDILIEYATPSDYVDAIHTENVILFCIYLNLEWAVNYDDMFPYSDDKYSYWTGYFSSRATDKEYTRRGSHLLHASGKLYSMMAIYEQYNSVKNVKDMLEGINTLMDAMGINQHHDAITGTAKQYVADDYVWKLYKAYQINNPIFGEAIDSSVKRISGIVTQEKWQMCFKENTTFMDCPIAQYRNQTVAILVAVYNPSSLIVNYTHIAVPNGKVDVTAFNYETNKFEKVNASVLCEQETVQDNSVVDNCQLYVDYAINPFQIGLLSLIINSEKDLLLQRQSYNKDQTIKLSTQFEQITYLKEDVNGQAFKIKKKFYNQEYSFAFDLRYWLSCQDDNQRSGAYIFRHDENFIDSQRFSKLANISYYESSIISQITFTYWDSETGHSAIVKARYFYKNPIAEWEVKINEIPLSNQGVEVTVVFWSDIDNNNTFYTDSNGLEMQKRILNYRPTYELTNYTNNVTINYYPINTAIVIRDNKQNQMTIMNDRSQGGSVLKPGRIELMQQRRTYLSDYRGMDEGLNETESSGKGKVVIGKYFLQIFNRDHEQSLQRIKQHHQDDPVQTFYNFNFTKDQLSINNSKHFIEIEQLQKIGFPSTGKIQMIPYDKNIILVRLENIADKFDNDSTSQNTQFKIYEFAKQLYQNMNGGQIRSNQISIEEVTLTGNQNESVMRYIKKKWKTVKDNREEVIVEDDRSNTEIALGPQRIRSFMIIYPHKNTLSDLEQQNIVFLQ